MKYSDEQESLAQMLNKPKIFASPIAYRHEFYLGDITEPEDYVDWFHTIRNASENDVVIFYINSNGGSADTTIQMLSALDDCDAQILMQVEGMCASAATMIFMKAQAFSIADHSQFMFHNYSGGAVGKGGEIEARVKHQSKWAETLLKECYKYFFTDNEFKQILDGKDFWMDSEEVVERMNKRINQYKKDYEKIEKEIKEKAKPKAKPKVEKVETKETKKPKK